MTPRGFRRRRAAIPTAPGSRARTSASNVDSGRRSARSPWTLPEDPAVRRASATTSGWLRTHPASAPATGASRAVRRAAPSRSLMSSGEMGKAGPSPTTGSPAPAPVPGIRGPTSPSPLSRDRGVSTGAFPTRADAWGPVRRIRWRSSTAKARRRASASNPLLVQWGSAVPSVSPSPSGSAPLPRRRRRSHSSGLPPASAASAAATVASEVWRTSRSTTTPPPLPLRSQRAKPRGSPRITLPAKASSDSSTPDHPVQGSVPLRRRWASVSSSAAAQGTAPPGNRFLNSARSVSANLRSSSRPQSPPEGRTPRSSSSRSIRTTRPGCENSSKMASARGSNLVRT